MKRFILGMGLLSASLSLAARDPIITPVPGPGGGGGFQRCRDGQGLVGMRLFNNQLIPICDYLPGTVLTQTRERVGYVSATGYWTEIPGLRVIVDLPRAARVNLASNGTIRKSHNGAGLCSVSFRYNIDGVPNGDPNYGKRNIASDALRSIWSFNDAVDLPAGRHVLTVEARSQNSSEGLEGACQVCSEHNGALSEYEGCSLTSTAVLQ